MKCPYCGSVNMAGSDDCEYCQGNLSSLDGVLLTKNRIKKILMEDPVSHLEPKAATVVAPTLSVKEAISLMNRKKVSCLLVGETTNIHGILTERDILFKVIAKKRRPEDVSVSEVMTGSPVTLEEEDSLACAVNKMSLGGYRHLPILGKGKPVGVISIQDLLKHLASFL
ncbi:MAG: CBS domain-containing protein [Deltaproteobacteria bacterium]|nr:CBS domain-containing protein [Deltaproteobacteria bacterium]MBI2501137.1 CBS domain-containing protein [Deltaproteobacteria bacterium]